MQLKEISGAKGTKVMQSLNQAVETAYSAMASFFQDMGTPSPAMAKVLANHQQANR